MATAAIAMADTTMALTVVVTSVPGASPVANGTSISAEDVASAAVAYGRLPAAVPLTVSLSAACDKGYDYILIIKRKVKVSSYIEHNTITRIAQYGFSVTP